MSALLQMLSLVIWPEKTRSGDLGPSSMLFGKLLERDVALRNCGSVLLRIRWLLKET